MKALKRSPKYSMVVLCRTLFFDKLNTMLKTLNSMKFEEIAGVKYQEKTHEKYVAYYFNTRL